MIAPDDVLSFWFGEGDRNDPALAKLRTPIWFGHDEATDEQIERRFGATLEAAAAGELDHWAATPQGRLALVIVLDQFSRNAYRDTPRMYAQDERALTHSLAAIDAGEDAKLAALERLFLYMPLEHSEDLELQNRCVDLFRRLHAEVDPGLKPSVQMYVDYAVKHQEFIARFGRFPHRNAILGRESTDEERAFLEQPNSSF